MTKSVGVEMHLRAKVIGFEGAKLRLHLASLLCRLAAYVAQCTVEVTLTRVTR